MPKRMERTDFSQCEESKRRKAIVEQQIDNNLPTSPVEEDLVRILYYLMALYLWFVLFPTVFHTLLHLALSFSPTTL